MHTYLKTKDGKIYIIWSSDLDYDGTYTCYLASDEFDPEYPYNLVKIHESDVAHIDTNLAIL